MKTALSVVRCTSRGWSRQLSSCPRHILQPQLQLVGQQRQLVHPTLVNLHRPCLVQYARLFHNQSNKLFASDSDGKKKESIVKRFKTMFKDYWYVLIPVHVFTSCFWFGGFYVLCKSGVDIPGVLAWFGTSEAYLEKLKNSNMGYIAMAYACYKVATPARYTVTVTGTTLTVRYLRDLGWLKTSAQVAENIKERKDIMKDRFDDEWEKAWTKYGKRKK